MNEAAKVVSREEINETGEKKTFFFKFKRSQLCIPYGVFLALFVVFPLMLIIYYAFTDKTTGAVTLYNFVKFFKEPTYISNMFISIGIGLVTTVVCLLIAYPIAFILSRFKSARSYILVMLFVMPMWINFVLRAMALKELLSLIGIFGEYNFLNTVIGMVYDFLPFMILPLYTTLIKRDRSLEEAAGDLGANGFQVFTKVTLPLSMPGIMSGVTMVFLPSMSCYVITDTFGNGKIPLIGKLIEAQFGENADWNFGSAMAIIMLLIMFVSMLATGGFKSENVRGNAL